MKNKTKVILIALLIASVVYALIPPASPKNPESPAVGETGKSEKRYKIMGFLPYWNYNKLSPQAKETITDLAYFSLQIDENGLIQKRETSVSEEPGWTRFKQLQREGTSIPLTVAFVQSDEKVLTNLLSNYSSRATVIGSIKEVVSSSGAKGVNIDFEPSGGVAPSLRDNFTLFMSELNQELDKDGVELSVDVYPTAASRKRLWDIKALSNHIDYLIVMTYDYHQTTSKTAGPNSPLRGYPLSYEEDILKNISEITKEIDEEKVLLGVPFYGYEWATTTADKYSLSEGGALASIERVDSLIRDKGLEVVWDRNSLTPYIIHEDDGVIKQVYFENSASIKLKLDLVKQANLGGIAIWALGYEGDNDRIWNTISALND